MSRTNEAGFSMIELLISAVVIGIMSGVIFIFFNSSISAFFNIQESSISINDKARTLYRMSQVIRSGTTITEASANSLTIFTYFSPQDSTLSQVRYYYDSSQDVLKVDRIQAVGTAPSYTYPPANKKTIELINDLALVDDLFEYFDANGSSYSFGPTTYKDIKTVSINLNTKSNWKKTSSQQQTKVELRNRKTNL